MAMQVGSRQQKTIAVKVVAKMNVRLYWAVLTFAVKFQL